MSTVGVRGFRAAGVLLVQLTLACGVQGCLFDKEKKTKMPTYSGKERVEETVGKAGAEIFLGSDLRLVIPADALEEEVKLRVSRTALDEVVAFAPQEALVSALVQVQPFEQFFVEPITVQMRVKRDDVTKKQLSLVQLENKKDESWLELEERRVLDPENGGGLDGLPKAEQEFRRSMRVEGKLQNTGVFGVFEFEAADGVGDGGVGNGDAAVPEVPVETLPFDVQSECADGCALQLSPLETNGRLRRCFPEGDPAEFDPDTFDFAAGCARLGSLDESSWYLYMGDAFLPGTDGPCEVRSVGTTMDDAYVSARCTESTLQLSADMRVARQDERLYFYDFDDCDGSCDPSLSVYRLDPADPGTVAEECLSESNVQDLRCGGLAGEVTLPFGTEQLGPVPEAVQGAWLACSTVVSSASAAELQAACADVASQPSVSVTRFNADGTSDALSLSGGPDAFTVTTGVCAALVGGDDTELRTVTGEGGSVQVAGFGYEVSREGGEDYLAVELEPGGDRFIYVRTDLGDLVSGEPCDGQPSASLVLQ